MSEQIISNSDLCGLLVDALRKDLLVLTVSTLDLSSKDAVFGPHVTVWFDDVVAGFESERERIQSGIPSVAAMSNDLHDRLGARILSLKLLVSSTLKPGALDLPDSTLATLLTASVIGRLQELYNANRGLRNRLRER